MICAWAQYWDNPNLDVLLDELNNLKNKYKNKIANKNLNVNKRKSNVNVCDIISIDTLHKNASCYTSTEKYDKADA